MRCVDARRLARYLATLVVGLLAFAAGCADGFAPLSGAPAPQNVSVTALRVDAVRVSWAPVAEVDVGSYIIERRVALAGPFAQVAVVNQTDLALLSWIDTDVEPETFYGYRVLAVTSVGDRSRPSVVGGARTPPLPGIELNITSLVTASDALDPDGYDVLIAGPDTVRATIGTATRRRFSPLRPGRYSVTLSGLVARCSVTGAATRSIDVIDTTATTITPVGFQVVCRDPSRGDIVALVTATGQAIDNEYRIDVLGEAADATLPPAERIYSSQRSLAVATPAAFPNLRPGTYDVTLEGVASNCSVTGGATRTVSVEALSVDTVRYAVVCLGDGPPPSTAPFVWRNRWSSRTPAAGSRVTLRAELDLTANSAQRVQGVQATLLYDPAVLRYEEEIAGQLSNLTVNGSVPGQVSFVAVSGVLRSGVVRVADFAFTVIGATGARTASGTQGLLAGSPAAFQDSIRVEEDTLTVGAGGSANASPTAEANGPYPGLVGVPVNLTAAGSVDSDGSIASYAWTFGDNTTGVGASPAKTYSAAGTYTVVLTVTDDDGATATDQATVTITAGGGSANVLPVAQANGPYTTVAGTPVALSSAGSSDPDGSIASFAWTLGNGQTVSGASPTVTYAAAGTYTVTLTVTDNRGGTASDQATVTVTAAPPPPPSQPIVWRNVVGPIDVVNNLVAITVSYDLRTNIAETPGVEALASFVVDSLKWDPSVLQFYAVNLGPNVFGTVNQSQAFAGKLSMTGTVSGAQSQGLITLVTIRFRLVGTPGSTTTTATTLGPLTGPSSTGFYIYNAKTRVEEGQVVVP